MITKSTQFWKKNMKKNALRMKNTYETMRSQIIKRNRFKHKMIKHQICKCFFNSVLGTLTMYECCSTKKNTQQHWNSHKKCIYIFWCNHKLWVHAVWTTCVEIISPKWISKKKNNSSKFVSGTRLARLSK